MNVYNMLGVAMIIGFFGVVLARLAQQEGFREMVIGAVVALGATAFLALAAFLLSVRTV